MDTVQSKINRVVVYQDRAEVTRRAVCTMSVGDHIVVFDDLPQDMEQNTIQARGQGKALLRDIKFQSIHFAETPHTEIKNLLENKQDLEDSMVDISDSMERMQKEKKFLEAIVGKLTIPVSSDEKGTPVEMDPEKWSKLVDLYGHRLENLDKEARRQEREQRRLINELTKVEQELDDLGNREYKTKNQVLVSLETQEAGEITVDLSYMVFGPGWYPVYDLRVSTEKKTMGIGYHALISQNTGEDWEDVHVSLSTAQAHMSGEQPHMKPWLLDIYKPIPSPRIAVLKSAAAEQPLAAQKRMQKQMFDEEETAEELSLEEQEKELLSEEAVVETHMTSVVFNISGHASIPADNLPHKQAIMMREFPTQFRYSTVPKLSPHAYLKAKTSNATDFPFLAGETHIFLDNSFVSKAQLDFIAPGEAFWMFLGIDDGMKVEHKLVKKFRKDEGVFAKKQKLLYEYLMIITNNKKTQEEIVVWDQIPQSSHGEISVQVLEPDLKAKNPKKDENEFLEWHFKPQPSEEIRIPLKFQIEYPRDQRVLGL